MASKFPEYDDDNYGTVTLQQFAHRIGITLYEGMWISRAYSLEYPAEIKENMYFAIETFAGHPGLEQTVPPRGERARRARRAGDLHAAPDGPEDARVIVDGEPSVPTYPDLAGKVAVVTGGSKGIGAVDLRAARAQRRACGGLRARPRSRSRA